MTKFVTDDIRCQGKVPYKRKEDALLKIHQTIKESFGGVGADLRPYRCRYCGFWHLTSTDK